MPPLRDVTTLSRLDSWVAAEIWTIVAVTAIVVSGQVRFIHLCGVGSRSTKLSLA